MRKVVFVILAMFLCAGCSQKTNKDVVRSVYYWRTTFNIAPEEKEFLKEHNISRMYLRLFDVVVNSDNEVMPNATIKFLSPLPDSIDFVPVVFITNDCMTRDVSDLPQKLYSRILQICETHDIPAPKEIQIDCDWTMKTRLTYFNMLKELHSLAKADGRRLTTTIRLHQLTQPIPPVDGGTLMVYNTGDVSDIKEQKPILDPAVVRKYAPRLRGYKLPLNSAYPIFSWDVLFRGGRYIGIMHGDDDLPTLKGDSIITRRPSLDDIMQAKDIVESNHDRISNEIIIYDLNKDNIKQLKHTDYEKIYSR